MSSTTNALGKSHIGLDSQMTMKSAATASQSAGGLMPHQPQQPPPLQQQQQQQQQQQLRYPNLHPLHPRNRPIPPAKPLPPHRPVQAKQQRHQPRPSTFRHPFNYTERMYVNMRLYGVLVNRAIVEPVDWLVDMLSYFVAFWVCFWGGVVGVGGVLLGGFASFITFKSVPLPILPPIPGNSMPRISVIVPTLNDAGSIVRTLTRVREVSPLAEIVVVDGGSNDGTVSCVRRLTGNVVILENVTGSRARRMNVGARISTGQFFVFLSAGNLLPDEFDLLVRDTLCPTPADVGPSSSVTPGTTATTYVAGTFVLGSELTTSSALAALIQTSNTASSFLRQPFHPSQILFMRSETFFFAGCFPDQPIFETYELVRRVNRMGPIKVISDSAVLISLDAGARHLAVVVDDLSVSAFNDLDIDTRSAKGAPSPFHSQASTFPPASSSTVSVLPPRQMELLPLSAWGIGMRLGAVGGVAGRAMMGLGVAMFLYVYLGMSADAVVRVICGRSDEDGGDVEAKEKAVTRRRKKERALDARRRSSSSVRRPVSAGASGGHGRILKGSGGGLVARPMLYLDGTSSHVSGGNLDTEVIASPRKASGVIESVVTAAEQSHVEERVLQDSGSDKDNLSGDGLPPLRFRGGVFCDDDEGCYGDNDCDLHGDGEIEVKLPRDGNLASEKNPLVLSDPATPVSRSPTHRRRSDQESPRRRLSGGKYEPKELSHNVIPPAMAGFSAKVAMSKMMVTSMEQQSPSDTSALSESGLSTSTTRTPGIHFDGASTPPYIYPPPAVYSHTPPQQRAIIHASSSTSLSSPSSTLQRRRRTLPSERLREE